MGRRGTASLILSEIPHRGRAYVLLRTVEEPDVPELTAECAAFCRGCGASEVFAAREGSAVLPGCAHAYDLLLLHREKEGLPLPGRPPELLPMTPENDPVYQRVYNRCFQGVSHAMTYDRAQIKRIYQMDQRAFLACGADGTPFGMGELHGSELAAVGLLPEFRGQGLSRDLTLALLRLCPGPELRLTVASDNEPALRLYDGLGFRVRETESRWWLVPA